MNGLTNTYVIPSAGSETDPALGLVCQTLGTILTDGIDIHRCQAARALGRIGSLAGVQPLIKALLDEDEDVRTDAAEALLELADPLAGEQLFENLLGDPCTEVKLAAIETLAKLQDRRVIPWLRRMVKGRDEEIAWDEEEFFSSGWDDWIEIQMAAVCALADLNATEAVPDIVNAIRDENAQDMTETAFRALAQMGSPGIAALADFLNEETTRPRRRAATALANVDSKDVERPLAQAFSDPSADVRLAVMSARAVKFPNDPHLSEMFKDPDVEVRATALQLIGRNHHDALIALLDDPANKVQTTALSVLASIEELDVSGQLIDAVRVKIGAKNAEISATAVNTLAAIAPNVALGELIPLVKDNRSPVAVRLGALCGLALIGGERAIDALVAVIDDPERQIRLETMSALVRLAKTQNVWPNMAGNALLSALQGMYEPEDTDEKKSGEVLEEATKIIEPPEIDVADISIDEDKAFPSSTLESILEDAPEIAEAAGLPDKGVELSAMDMERLAIAKNVVGKKKMVTKPVVVKHQDIRCFAARVLGDLNQNEVAMELAQTLGAADAETRMTAADSLARIGSVTRAFPSEIEDILISAIESADRDLKLLLIRSLAACNGENIVELLGKYLNDEDSFVRSEAIRALSRLGKIDANIEAHLDDLDPSVRLSAAEAIAATARPGAVDLLVSFSFSFEGHHRRHAARLLRKLNPVQASAKFLDVLGDPEKKRVWSVAIEALEELNGLQVPPDHAGVDHTVLS